LKHKLSTLTGKCGVPPSVIVDRPSLLGYSIEKRILPRMRAMLEGAAATGEQTITVESVETSMESVENVETKRIKTKGRRRIRRRVCEKRDVTPRPAFNVNALYLSDAKFEEYLETSAMTRSRLMRER
jgi:hypothetical protein